MLLLTFQFLFCVFAMSRRSRTKKYKKGEQYYQPCDKTLNDGSF